MPNSLVDLLRQVKPLPAMPDNPTIYSDREHALLKAVQSWKEMHGRRYVGVVEVLRILDAIASIEGRS